LNFYFIIIGSRLQNGLLRNLYDFSKKLDIAARVESPAKTLVF
jgi:hypothetical protein